MLECIQVQQPKTFGRQHEFTGYDGSHNWKVVHDEMQKIGCDFCKEKGIKLMRGVHASVSVHLDKDPVYPKEIDYVLQHVTYSARKLSSTGLRCENCQ